jgi:hypothetical protein
MITSKLVRNSLSPHKIYSFDIGFASFTLRELQTATLRRVEGAQAARTYEGGQVIGGPLRRRKQGGVARTMLPELLRYDPTRPASYPHNGRRPSDDTADAFLTVITNGKVTGDGVGPTAICSLLQLTAKALRSLDPLQRYSASDNRYT